MTDSRSGAALMLKGFKVHRQETLVSRESASALMALEIMGIEVIDS